MDVTPAGLKLVELLNGATREEIQAATEPGLI
jgi:acyl CoA:acetate/3-ketoacid CoA transferase beta subunit